ncbi:i-AAA protease yme1 [Lecanora helva]
MESTANNNPTSATAQNAFYSALLRADMPAILVERFQSGRYASNSACETTYHRALEKLARSESASAIGGGSQLQGRNNVTNEQLQAIGQAVAGQVKGGHVIGAKPSSSGTGDKASPLYVVVEESMGAGIFKWLKFLTSFLFFGYIALVSLQLVVETSGVLKRVGGLGANEAQPQHQTVRFADVHGCDEAKDELQELVEFLRNPEKFNTLGGKLPKGVLLTGPPGTGKTLLARAIAGESGVPFFFMSGSEFEEMYVGVGAKRVRELFTAARSKAPAIVFIDELDALGGRRNERDPSHVKQSLNQLLTELDGFSQDTGVIIVAATNFPQLLDKALTRPGRFDRKIAVPLPDVRGRMQILKHHMKNVQIATDVDASIIARGTSGFSGAELENLVNQAAVRASRNKAQKVSMQDFDWAKDRIMLGAERRSAVVQDKDKIMTAYHEAGHALVAMYTKGATPLYKATILPRGQSLGMTSMMPDMDKVSVAKNEYLASIDVAMGGKVAETLIYGENNVTSGCSSDITNATSAAYQMVTQNGMSDTLGNFDYAATWETLSSETKHRVESEARRLIEEGHARATALLSERRNELDILAKALVEYEVLSSDEMKKVLRGEKLSKMKAERKGVLKLPEIVLPPGIGSSTGPETATRGSASARIEDRDGSGDGGAKV